MNLKLDDKIAFITGSTAGIGFSIAETMAQEKAIVIINGRTRERVDAAIKKILERNAQAKLIPMVADVATDEGMVAITKEIPSLDILVNNYGMYDAKPLAEISDEEWLRLFNHNVMSGIKLSRQYLPRMLNQNWGRIIFVSSESALQIPPEMIHYGMTKTAQLAVARGLAELTTKSGVTVNSILPGPVRSEGVEKFLKQMAEKNNKTLDEMETDFFISIRPSSLLKRFINPEEVGDLVTFLCSPLSSAINGTALRIDGGVIRSIV